MYDVEYDELKDLCDPKTGYYNEPEMAKPKQLFESYKLRQPGSMYKDLTMEDLNGKQVKLSQWVAKASMYWLISGQAGVVLAVRKCQMSLRLTSVSRIKA